MRKAYLVLLVIFLFALFLVPAGFAAEGPPVGVCPTGFHLHDFHDHEHGNHVGLRIDLNGNGMICVKHIDGELHVHMDDVLLVE